MKILKYIIIIISILLFSFNGNCQVNKNNNKLFKEIISIKWNTEDGIKTKDYPEGRFGAADFFIDNKYVYILCNVERNIKKFNLKNGKLETSIKLKGGLPNCFTVDTINELFYVSTLDGIYIVNTFGKYIDTIKYENRYDNVSKLKYQNGDVFAITNYKLTFPITESGKVLENIKTPETDLLLLNNGILGKTTIINNHEFLLKLLYVNKSYIEKKIHIDEKIISIRPIGCKQDYCVILVDYIFSDVPLFAKQKILIYSLIDEVIIKELEVPYIYYIYFPVSEIRFIGENLYHFISTPQSADIIQIDIENPLLLNKYPKKYEYKYDYYDSLEKY